MLMSMIMLQMENHFSAKQQKHEKDYHNSGHTDQPGQPSVSFLNVQVTIPLKYLSIFRRSLDLPLINSEVGLDLSWTKEYNLVVHDNNITGVNFIIALIDDYSEYYF